MYYLQVFKQLRIYKCVV